MNIEYVFSNSFFYNGLQAVVETTHVGRPVVGLRNQILKRYIFRLQGFNYYREQSTGCCITCFLTSNIGSVTKPSFPTILTHILSCSVCVTSGVESTTNDQAIFYHLNDDISDLISNNAYQLVLQSFIISMMILVI